MGDFKKIRNGWTIRWQGEQTILKIINKFGSMVITEEPNIGDWLVIPDYGRNFIVSNEIAKKRNFNLIDNRINNPNAWCKVCRHFNPESKTCNRLHSQPCSGFDFYPMEEVKK